MAEQPAMRSGRIGGMVVSLSAHIMPWLPGGAAFIMLRPMQLVLISGLSGSGKSIALAVLEDAGYYCVDNLPADMLPVLVGHLRRDGYTRIGVAVDVRSGPSLEALPQALDDLRRDARVSVLFLDASDETLLQRFSETRRAHPLTSETMTLADIALYAYTHVADEAGFSLNDYPAIENWLARVAAEPGHVPITA